MRSLLGFAYLGVSYIKKLCFRYINGTRLDDRIVRTDWDAGFIEGRQYGRGKTGGQVSIGCFRPETASYDNAKCHFYTQNAFYYN